MPGTMRRKVVNGEDGFTLIELMVVVLIIAILMAIAIPTFLGAQNKAKDRSAQSDARNALTAARSQSVDFGGSFYKTTAAITDAAGLAAVEPALQFQDTIDATLSNGKVGVAVGALGVNINLVRKSSAGDYMCITSTNAGVVSTGRSATVTNVDTAAKCIAAPVW